MNKQPGPGEVEILERKTVYQGYFRIDAYKLRHTLFEGGWSRTLSREVFERGHAAGLLAYDPDRREFVMCEQFRVGAYAADADAWQLEVVAGIIEDGEKPEDVARRETKEEIGQAISDLWPIQRYLVSPGGASESIYLYLGRVSSADAEGIFGAASEDEHIRVKIVKENELRSLMEHGALTNAMTLIAAQWFFLNHEQIRRRWQSTP
jgi:ADP-ribose pyrophosphatase